MRHFFQTTLLALAASLTGSAAIVAAEKDIVDTAVSAGSFNTLVAAVKAADLVETLKGKGPFTVFAPTDEAFAKLPPEAVADLLKPENKKKLVSVLTYHVVAGEVPASKVVKLTGAKTVNGQQVDVKVDGDAVMVDGAKVIATDITCSNGIIHVIDSVILPSTDNLAEVATKAGKFNTLVAAAKAAGLVPALVGDTELTVFAPTDEAFAKLPEGTVANLLKPENKEQLASILKYHIVAGRVYSTDALAAKKAKTLEGNLIFIKVEDGAAKVNDAHLVATDIDASNGVIHVIDSVILPPAKSTSVHPRRMIEMAIQKGAPLYNAGHVAACSQVYSSTIQSLLSQAEPSIDDHTTHALKTALTESKSCTCQETNAWTLRRALDTAYRSMASVR